MSFAIRNIVQNLVEILYTLPVLILAFPLHECAHGFVAYLLGDRTAKEQGRLTLNPFKHLDLLGTICLVFLHFGWAKPVPVNPYNFKNRRQGMALTAIAGPFSNLLMGFLSLLLLKILLMFTSLPMMVITFFVISAQINIGLFIFNLIPIPPLDGSRILALFLPGSVEEAFYRYGMYFQFLLLLLIFNGSGLLSQLVSNVYNNFLIILQLS